MPKRQPTTYRVYEFLQAYQRRHDRPPTIREIAAALNLATSTIDRHLGYLEKMRKIVREPHTARGIRLLGDE
jgi:repressor LexA